MRSRTVSLAERRSSLVRLLIALLVARIVVTLAELTEQRLSVISLVVTAALSVEAGRAYSVSRHAGAHEVEASGEPGGVDRVLTAFERFGPPLLYALTIGFVIAYVALELGDRSQETLLDVTVIAREVTTLVFLAVIVLGYAWLRRANAAGKSAAE